MDKETLKKFLVASNKAGYASGEEKKWIKEGDKSTTIPFKKGLWRSHDNYFGGEPYGGRVAVFYGDKPVWIMVYYGWVEEGVEANSVYEILKNAFMKMPKDHPYRGPKKHKEGNYIYTNNWKGEVERFSGVEKIAHKGEVVYEASYMGGLVDKN